MTIARTEFTKDMARIMGDGRNANRVLICHGVDKLRQLALHALLRPNYTLMDVCGVIPEDYLWGEIILPVFIPINKIFASLVVWQGAKWGTYNPESFKAEIGARFLPMPSVWECFLTLSRTYRLFPSGHSRRASGVRL